MRSLGFDENIVRLISNFLGNRTQCAKFSGSFSDYKCIKVGSSQGTKLGPVLWLIYVNDLECDGFYSMKYAPMIQTFTSHVLLTLTLTQLVTQ